MRSESSPAKVRDERGRTAGTLAGPTRLRSRRHVIPRPADRGWRPAEMLHLSANQCNELRWIPSLPKDRTPSTLLAALALAFDRDGDDQRGGLVVALDQLDALDRALSLGMTAR